MKLRRAAEKNDHGEIMRMIDQLQGLTVKRFTGLDSVLKILSDPNRVLRHIRPDSDTLDTADDSDKSSSVAEPHSEVACTGSDETIDVEEIVKAYKAQMPIRDIAAYNGINTHKIVKILVTAGVYESEIYDQIKELRMAGKTDAEIASILSISKSTLNDYTPYKKCMYNLCSPTENAIKIRKYRKSKQNE